MINVSELAAPYRDYQYTSIEVFSCYKHWYYYLYMHSMKGKMYWNIDMIAVCRILVWEDGFCNFSACSSATTSDSTGGSSNSFLSVRQQAQQDVEDPESSMNPELFFKMSHEVYNYGEG